MLKCFRVYMNVCMYLMEPFKFFTSITTNVECIQVDFPYQFISCDTLLISIH